MDALNFSQQNKSTCSKVYTFNNAFCCKQSFVYLQFYLNSIGYFLNQSRTNGPINAHLTIAQVMPRYNHNNEKQEALL